MRSRRASQSAARDEDEGDARRERRKPNLCSEMERGGRGTKDGLSKGYRGWRMKDGGLSVA